jgi:hypothetical protein
MDSDHADHDTAQELFLSANLYAIRHFSWVPAHDSELEADVKQARQQNAAFQRDHGVNLPVYASLPHRLHGRE